MERKTVPFLSFGHPVGRALAGFALASAALVGWQQLGAQGLGSHNSNAPVEFDADRIELQDKQNRVVLSGDVVISQDNLRLRAARTTVAYTDDGELQIQRIDATGGVLVTRGNESARGAVGVYDFNKRLIILSGDVSLRRGSDTLRGGRLVIDLRTGLSSVDGQGSSTGNRVSGSFTVPD